MKEITINWHIIEKCNYSCSYCFAKYQRTNQKKLQQSKKDINIFLDKLYSYFKNKYPEYLIRLNLAGGEPTLSKNLSYIIRRAYRIGFKISLITNASKLTTTFIEENAKYISIFAVSIDSLESKTNVLIGRETKHQTLKISKLIASIEKFRLIHPEILIKINTVVNTYNNTEFMGHFIDLIKPHKWKVLQALSVNTIQMFCTDQEYQTFLNNHKSISSKIYTESKDDMTNSYIMLDPYGRFYQNGNDSYTYSKSILEISVEEAFSSIDFDLSKYFSRYKHNAIKKGRAC